MVEEYTREDYEHEKSLWPPSDLPKTDAEDEHLFKLCGMRRNLVRELDAILDTAWMKRIPMGERKV